MEFLSSLIHRILEFPKTHIPHLSHFSEYSRLLKILGFISVVYFRHDGYAPPYSWSQAKRSTTDPMPVKNRNNPRVLSLMVLFHESDHQPIEGTLFVFLMTCSLIIRFFAIPILINPITRFGDHLSSVTETLTVV